MEKYQKAALELSKTIHEVVLFKSEGPADPQCFNVVTLHTSKYCFNVPAVCAPWESYKAELQWLEHLWDYKNLFEIGVVRANEC